MRPACFAALALLAFGPARAELALGSYDRADTPYGQVTVAGENGNRSLLLNGQPVGIDGFTYLTIEGVFQLQGEAAVWVLVAPGHGGNMCPSQKVILRLSPQGASRTGFFGECLGTGDAVRVLPGRFEIDLADPDLAIAHQTFAFDGAQLTVTPVATVEQATPAGAGPDVTRWIGQHPASPLGDAAERARFRTIMSAADMGELSQHIGPADPAFERGGWVLGAGCFPHQCNMATGGWAIRIADGAVAAFMLEATGQSRSFGMVSDPTVAAFMNESRPK